MFSNYLAWVVRPTEFLYGVKYIDLASLTAVGMRHCDARVSPSGLAGICLTL